VAADDLSEGILSVPPGVARKQFQVSFAHFRSISRLRLQIRQGFLKETHM
jgi:hypothetical protein